jgi:hypothetical protein
MRFEPTIPALEQMKTVHALDCAAIAIGDVEFNDLISESL